jgi:hypothetical protein
MSKMRILFTSPVLVKNIYTNICNLYIKIGRIFKGYLYLLVLCLHKLSVAYNVYR